MIKYTIIAAMFLLAAPVPSLAADGNGMAGMRIYSGLTPVKGGSQYVGFQITMIPYIGGEKVLWRDQENDPLKAPLFLDATSTGTGWKVTVPGGTHPTDWFLIQQNNMLLVQDPWGLHFQLNEVQPQ